MADNTQNFSLPFPEGDDAVVPHLDIENLAVATDASLKVVSNSIQSVEQGTTEIVERIDQEIEEIKGDVQNLGSVNVEEIMSSLEASQAELEAAKEDFSISQAEMQGLIDQLNEERLPELEDALEKALEAFDGDFQDFLDRYKDFEDDIEQAKSDIADAKNRLNVTESDVADAKADAATAKTDADKAIADALAAANLAEGKGQVITQVSAPTGSRAREENLWVRLPDMKVHYYDGDKWKPVLDPDTIAAAQQAANALSKANDLQTKHDALQLAVDGEGGLKDRLSTAENTLEDKADSSALSELDQKLDAIEIPDVSGLASKTELQQGLQDAATDAQTKADAAVTKAREALEAFAHAGDNLIYNGSFEHGWDGWRRPRGEIVEDDDARSGEHILVLGRETGNDYPMTEYVSAEKGHVYLVEYWAKKLPGGTDPRELRLYTQTLLTDGSTPGAYARNEQGAVALADVADMPENEWVKLSGTIEVTHDTATGISFGPHILATGTQFHIDVLRAVDVTEAKAALEAAASAQNTADEAHEAAGTAQSTANSALTMAGSKSTVTYSTSAPAGTASAGDTHRQQNESGDIIGEWEYTDDSWQKRQVSSDAISNLDVGKLTAGTTEVAEGVFGKLWADDVAVNNLQAREGWVGGVNLEDGAVTAAKIEATREMITKIMGAEWAYISEQLVVEGELIANNATLINAAIQNLDVTEKANLVEALVDQLYADEFTARVASMARAIVGSPNLIPGMSNIKNETPPPFTGTPYPWGRNPGHPSIWIQSTSTDQGNITARTSDKPEALIPLEEGEMYKFKIGGSANKAGTRFYVQLLNQNGNSVRDTIVNGTKTSYLISNVTAGSSPTNPLYYESEFEVPETGKYRLQIYSSHPNGTPNPNSYQWFHGMAINRLQDGNLIVENTIKAAQLDVQNIFSDSIVANQIYASAVRAKLLEADEALIGGTLLKNNAVTTDKIAANAITAGKVAANAITAGKISGNAITADKIAGGAIDGKTITGATITGGVVRTSASGARVQMQNDALTAYNASNTVQARYSGSGIELRPPGGTLTSIGPHIFGSEVITRATNQPWVSGTTIAEGSSNGWSSFLTNATNTTSFTCVSTDYVIDFSFMYIPGGGNMNEAYASVLSQIQMARTSSDSRTVMNRTFHTRGWIANTEYPLNYTAKITVPASWIGTSMYPRFQFRSRAVNWGASVHSFIFKATPT